MATDKIKGITVEIDGDTTKLGDALKDINKESNSLQKELAQVEKLLKLDPTNVELLAQKQELLGKQAENAAARVDVMAKAQDEFNKLIASGEIDKGSEEYRKFERDVASANISLDKAIESVEDFGKKEDEVEKTGKAFEKVKDIAGKVGSAVKAVAETFAAIGAAAVAAVGAAAGKVAELTKGAAQYADDVVTLSTQTGVAAETLQAYQYVEQLVDVSTETLTGSMKKNIASMQSAAKGTGAAAEAYEKLGVSVTNSDGSLRNSEEVYWELIDALGQVEDTTERDALAMSVLGKSAQDLNPLIETGSEALGEMMQEAYDAGAVLSGDTLNSLLGVSDAMERMKSSGKAVTNQLGSLGASLMTEVYKGATNVEQAFAGMISTVASGGEITDEMTEQMTSAVVDLVKNVVNEIPALLSAAKEIITAIAAAAEEALPEVLATVTEIFPSIVDTLLSMLPTFIDVGLQLFVALVGALPEIITSIVEKIPQIIDSVVSALGSAIPLFISAGVKIFVALVEHLPEIITKIVEAIPKIIQSILDSLKDALPTIINAGVQLFVSLIEALPTIIDTILAALPQIIDSIITALFDAIPLLINAGIQLFVALVQAMPEITLTIVSRLPEIITSIITALCDAIPQLVDAGVQLFVAIIENAPAIIAGIVEKIPEIIAAIVEGFTSAIPQIAAAGTQLIQGLWQGIKDAGAWLKDKISGFFDGVVDSIKDFFGIHSPSTLFRDQIGKNLALGIGEGFADEMYGISKEMQDAIPTSFDTKINAAYHNSYDSGHTANFELITPISVGGKNIAKVTSRIQYNEKIGRARVVGVTAE